MHKTTSQGCQRNLGGGEDVRTFLENKVRKVT